MIQFLLILFAILITGTNTQAMTIEHFEKFQRGWVLFREAMNPEFVGPNKVMAWSIPANSPGAAHFKQTQFLEPDPKKNGGLVTLVRRKGTKDDHDQEFAALQRLLPFLGYDLNKADLLLGNDSVENAIKINIKLNAIDLEISKKYNEFNRLNGYNELSYSCAVSATMDSIYPSLHSSYLLYHRRLDRLGELISVFADGKPGDIFSKKYQNEPLPYYLINSIISEARRLAILQPLAEQAARLYGIELPQYPIIVEANKMIEEFLSLEDEKNQDEDLDIRQSVGEGDQKKAGQLESSKSKKKKKKKKKKKESEHPKITPSDLVEDLEISQNFEEVGSGKDESLKTAPVHSVADEEPMPAAVLSEGSNAHNRLEELRKLGLAKRANNRQQRAVQMGAAHAAEVDEKARVPRLIHDVPDRETIEGICGQLSKSDQQTYKFIFAKNADLQIKSLEKVFELAQNIHKFLLKSGVSPKTAQTFLDAVQVNHPAHSSDSGKALPQAFVDIIRLRFLRYIPQPGYECRTIREFENLQTYYRNLGDSIAANR